MSDVKDWSSTNSNNNQSSPNGAQTNWTGADLGPWARETMAAVHRYYSDPAWVAPLVDEATSATNPSNTATFTVASTSTLVSHFPTGRLMRIETAGGQVLAFVVSHTFSSGTNTITASQTIPNGALALSGIEFWAGQTGDTLGSPQAVGAMSFGGSGTASARNTKYGSSATNLPDGIFWNNTDTNTLEMTDSGAWVPIASVGPGRGWEDVDGAQGPRTLRITSLNNNAPTLALKVGSDEALIKYDSLSNLFSVEGATTGQSTKKSRLIIEDASGKPYFQYHDGAGWSGAANWVDAIGIPGHTSGKNTGWYHESTQISWSSSTTGSYAHGLKDDDGNDVRPRLVEVSALLTGSTNDGNFVAGEEVFLGGSNGDGGNTSGFTVLASTTNIRYRVRAITINNISNSNAVTLSPNSGWRLIIRAWR